MEERPMPLSEHLGELRRRLMRCVLVLTIAFIVAYGFHDELFRWFARPVLSALRRHGIVALQALQVTETITVYLKLSLVAGMVVTAPYLFYQLWAFVAPGLYPRERRYVIPMAILTSLFFVVGIVFCYFVFLPMVIDFLVGFTLSSGDVALVPTVERTYGLVLTFFLVFGVIFELPLVMFFLSLLGLVKWRTFLGWGRYFIVLAFVIGAIFTPPEPLSQLLMAVPLCLLYYIGVGFSFATSLFGPRRSGRMLAGIVGGGITVAFVAGVIVASYAWGRSNTSPPAGPILPDRAAFVLKAVAASPLARQVLTSVGAPIACDDPDQLPDEVIAAGSGSVLRWMAHGQDLSCPDGGSSGWCLIQGDPLATAQDPQPVLTEIDRMEGDVGLVLSPQCARTLFVDGLQPPPDVGVALDATRSTNGLSTVVLRLVPATAENSEDWLRTLANRPIHADSAPSGVAIQRFMALAEGDLEVHRGPAGPIASVTVSQGRAARLVAALLGAARSDCLPAED